MKSTYGGSRDKKNHFGCLKKKIFVFLLPRGEIIQLRLFFDFKINWNYTKTNIEPKITNPISLPHNSHIFFSLFKKKYTLSISPELDECGKVASRLIECLRYLGCHTKKNNREKRQFLFWLIQVLCA